MDLSPAPCPSILTDRSKAVLLLWFTISVIVCLCIYVLMILFFIILNSRLASFGNETVLLRLCL